METHLIFTVEDARKDDATLRTIERNLRLGRYTGRNSASQDEHVAQLRENVTLAHRQLLLAGHRGLVGLLVEEAALARRVSENADAGNRRPELRSRLVGVRRAIRQAVS